MKSNKILVVIGLLGGGYALYKFLGGSSVFGGTGAYIKPGQTYGGYSNTTGAGVWVNLAGQILNATGDILGQIHNWTPPPPTNTTDNIDWNTFFDAEVANDNANAGVDTVPVDTGGGDTYALAGHGFVNMPVKGGVIEPAAIPLLGTIKEIKQIAMAFTGVYSSNRSICGV